MAFDLYNFKWEASPGLEHHCGTLDPLVLALAFIVSLAEDTISSCISYVEKAHECKSCIRADEMHHQRHRTIAKLVKDLEAHDREIAARTTRTKTKTGRANPYATPGKETVDRDGYIRKESVSKTSDDNVENVDPVRTANDEDQDDDDTYSNRPFHEEETAPFITIPHSRTHMSVSSTPGPASSISSFGYESSPAVSAKKKDLKKARRTARLTNNNAQSIVSNSFLEFIAEALHGSKITDISSAVFEEEVQEVGGNQFKSEELMRENLGFQQFNRNAWQAREVKDRWRKIGPRGKAEELAGPDPTAPGFSKPKFININETTRFDINFFARVGINYENKNDTSRVRGVIVLKLANKILEDMTIMRREEYETQIREAGFWRFVNRAAAQNIQEAHEDFSWVTGEYRKRRNPGMMPEGNAETELEDNVMGGPGQEIQGNENDFSDEYSLPDMPSLVGSAFETQVEEEKEDPQMKAPFVLKFTNFDSGKKEVIWAATPTKILSSRRSLPSLKPAVLTWPEASSSAKFSSPEVLPSREAVSSPRVTLSPKVPSTPQVPPAPKVLFSPQVWSSHKVIRTTPTPSRPKSNYDTQKRLGPMGSFRLVKIEKKHVAVPSKQESSWELCSDQFGEVQTGSTVPNSQSAPFEADADNTEDDDDMWEVVRPSLPNIRAKNPYDLLRTVEEGEGKDDSSSDEGSTSN
ncbi:hypothetical protein V490_01482 [Pseudogymnoascus sp. VKM F-3557]|nr:hypothetical protein V490_01482 [Pseudogymnoascus sp. VKM F-3557]